MNDLFRDKFWGTKEFASDLISLRLAGQEDLLSRIVSKAKWPFRIPCIGVSDPPPPSFPAGWRSKGIRGQELDFENTKSCCRWKILH